MQAYQGKYDFLITALLPIHKRLLTVQDLESLQICIIELKEYIGLFDPLTDKQLFDLFKVVNLTINADLEPAERARIFGETKDKVLTIFTQFMSDLNPDEQGSFSMPSL